jgi:hypothetical protein|tara:strand:+ start:8169 stop:8804 length:636 start_codon:yes stop_codon:yes gene_type:complete
VGKTETRVKQGVNDVLGHIFGDSMLDTLKSALVIQEPFKTMFGENGERIFVEDFPAINESILPAWQFQFESDTIQGQDLYHRGFVSSRIIFPTKMRGAFGLYRKVAMVIARYFQSDKCVSDFIKNVPGLTEFGEDLTFNYGQVYRLSGVDVPVLTMRFAFQFDLRKVKLHFSDTDFNDDLHAELLGAFANYIEITNDKEEILVETAEVEGG